jgi:arsenate reductase
LYWSFDDPAAAQGTHEEKLAVFRRVRDEIAQKIDKELAPPPATQRARR